MLGRPKSLFYLDLILLATFLSLSCLIIYLLARSVVFKLNDCGGFYSGCHETDLRINPDKFGPRLISLLKDIKGWLVLFKPYSSGAQGTDEKPPNIYANRDWNYDWTGLNQYAILITLLVIALFGFISALLRRRILIFIAISLYLVHIIQLALIEATDDRNFPPNVYRQGHTIARYSLIYLDNSNLALVLKSVLLLLLSTEFIILILYFVILRYEFFYLASIKSHQSKT